MQASVFEIGHSPPRVPIPQQRGQQTSQLEESKIEINFFSAQRVEDQLLANSEIFESNLLLKDKFFYQPLPALDAEEIIPVVGELIRPITVLGRPYEDKENPYEKENSAPSFIATFTLDELLTYVLFHSPVPLEDIQIVGGMVYWLLRYYLIKHLKSLGINDEKITGILNKIPSDLDIRVSVPNASVQDLTILNQLVAKFIASKLFPQDQNAWKFCENLVVKRGFKKYFTPNPEVNWLAVTSFNHIDLLFVNSTANQRKSLFVQDSLRFSIRDILDLINKNRWELLQSKNYGGIDYTQLSQSAGRLCIENLSSSQIAATIIPESDEGGGWQAVFERLAKLIRAKNPETINEDGPFLLSAAFTNGKRSVQNDLIGELWRSFENILKKRALYKRIDPDLFCTSKLSELAIKAVENHLSNDPTAAFVMTLNLSFSLLSIHPEWISDLWKRLSPTFAYSTHPLVSTLHKMYAETQDFQSVIAFLQAKAFLHLCSMPEANFSSDLIMHQQEAGVQVYLNDFCFLLPFDPLSAFDYLSKSENFEFLKLVNESLFPNAPYGNSKESILSRNCQSLGYSWEVHQHLAEKLVSHKNPVIGRIGSILMLVHSLQEPQTAPLNRLIDFVPTFLRDRSLEASFQKIRHSLVDYYLENFPHEAPIHRWILTLASSLEEGHLLRAYQLWLMEKDPACGLKLFEKLALRRPDLSVKILLSLQDHTDSSEIFERFLDLYTRCKGDYKFATLHAKCLVEGIRDFCNSESFSPIVTSCHMLQIMDKFVQHLLKENCDLAIAFLALVNKKNFTPIVKDPTGIYKTLSDFWILQLKSVEDLRAIRIWQQMRNAGIWIMKDQSAAYRELLMKLITSNKDDPTLDLTDLVGDLLREKNNRLSHVELFCEQIPRKLLIDQCLSVLAYAPTAAELESVFNTLKKVKPSPKIWLEWVRAALQGSHVPLKNKALQMLLTLTARKGTELKIDLSEYWALGLNYPSAFAGEEVLAIFDQIVPLLTLFETPSLAIKREALLLQICQKVAESICQGTSQPSKFLEALEALRDYLQKMELLELSKKAQGLLAEAEKLAMRTKVQQQIGDEKNRLENIEIYVKQLPKIEMISLCQSVLQNNPSVAELKKVFIGYQALRPISPSRWLELIQVVSSSGSFSLKMQSLKVLKILTLEKVKISDPSYLVQQWKGLLDSLPNPPSPKLMEFLSGVFSGGGGTLQESIIIAEKICAYLQDRVQTCLEPLALPLLLSMQKQLNSWPWNDLVEKMEKIFTAAKKQSVTGICNKIIHANSHNEAFENWEALKCAVLDLSSLDPEVFSKVILSLFRLRDGTQIDREIFFPAALNILKGKLSQDEFRLVTQYWKDSAPLPCEWLSFFSSCQPEHGLLAFNLLEEIDDPYLVAEPKIRGECWKVMLEGVSGCDTPLFVSLSERLPYLIEKCFEGLSQESKLALVKIIAKGVQRYWSSRGLNEESMIQGMRKKWLLCQDQGITEVLDRCLMSLYATTGSQSLMQITCERLKKELSQRTGLSKRALNAVLTLFDSLSTLRFQPDTIFFNHISQLIDALKVNSELETCIVPVICALGVSPHSQFVEHAWNLLDFAITQRKIIHASSGKILDTLVINTFESHFHSFGEKLKNITCQISFDEKQDNMFSNLWLKLCLKKSQGPQESKSLETSIRQIIEILKTRTYQEKEANRLAVRALTLLKKVFVQNEKFPLELLEEVMQAIEVQAKKRTCSAYAKKNPPMSSSKTEDKPDTSLQNDLKRKIEKELNSHKMNFLIQLSNLWIPDLEKKKKYLALMQSAMETLAFMENRDEKLFSNLLERYVFMPFGNDETSLQVAHSVHVKKTLAEANKQGMLKNVSNLLPLALYAKIPIRVESKKLVLKESPFEEMIRRLLKHRNPQALAVAIHMIQTSMKDLIILFPQLLALNYRILLKGIGEVTEDFAQEIEALKSVCLGLNPEISKCPEQLMVINKNDMWEDVTRQICRDVVNTIRNCRHATRENRHEQFKLWKAFLITSFLNHYYADYGKFLEQLKALLNFSQTHFFDLKNWKYYAERICALLLLKEEGVRLNRTEKLNRVDFFIDLIKELFHREGGSFFAGSIDLYMKVLKEGLFNSEELRNKKGICTQEFMKKFHSISHEGNFQEAMEALIKYSIPMIEYYRGHKMSASLLKKFKWAFKTCLNPEYSFVILRDVLNIPLDPTVKDAFEEFLADSISTYVNRFASNGLILALTIWSRAADQKIWSHPPKPCYLRTLEKLGILILEDEVPSDSPVQKLYAEYDRLREFKELFVPIRNLIYRRCDSMIRKGKTKKIFSELVKNPCGLLDKDEKFSLMFETIQFLQREGRLEAAAAFLTAMMNNYPEVQEHCKLPTTFKDVLKGITEEVVTLGRMKCRLLGARDLLSHPYTLKYKAAEPLTLKKEIIKIAKASHIFSLKEELSGMLEMHRDLLEGEKFELPTIDKIEEQIRICLSSGTIPAMYFKTLLSMILPLRHQKLKKRVWEVCKRILRGKLVLVGKGIDIALCWTYALGIFRESPKFLLKLLNQHHNLTKALSSCEPVLYHFLNRDFFSYLSNTFNDYETFFPCEDLLLFFRESLALYLTYPKEKEENAASEHKDELRHKNEYKSSAREKAALEKLQRQVLLEVDIALAKGYSTNPSYLKWALQCLESCKDKAITPLQVQRAFDVLNRILIQLSPASQEWEQVKNVVSSLRKNFSKGIDLSKTIQLLASCNYPKLYPEACCLAVYCVESGSNLTEEELTLVLECLSRIIESDFVTHHELILKCLCTLWKVREKDRDGLVKVWTQFLDKSEAYLITLRKNAMLTNSSSLSIFLELIARGLWALQADPFIFGEYLHRAFEALLELFNFHEELFDKHFERLRNTFHELYMNLAPAEFTSYNLLHENFCLFEHRTVKESNAEALSKISILNTKFCQQLVDMLTSELQSQERLNENLQDTHEKKCERQKIASEKIEKALKLIFNHLHWALHGVESSEHKKELFRLIQDYVYFPFSHEQVKLAKRHDSDSSMLFIRPPLELFEGYLDQVYQLSCWLPILRLDSLEKLSEEETIQNLNAVFQTCVDQNAYYPMLRAIAMLAGSKPKILEQNIDLYISNFLRVFDGLKQKQNMAYTHLWLSLSLALRHPVNNQLYGFGKKESIRQKANTLAKALHGELIDQITRKKSGLLWDIVCENLLAFFKTGFFECDDHDYLKFVQQLWDVFIVDTGFEKKKALKILELLMAENEEIKKNCASYENRKRIANAWVSKLLSSESKKDHENGRLVARAIEDILRGN